MASPGLTHTGQTGPRTAEGKAISSQNATTHGLSSPRVVLPHEDQAAFNQLLSDLQKDLAPTGAHEAFLTQQMAESQWRLNRLRRIETALMNQMLLAAEPGPDPEDKMAKALLDRAATDHGDPLAKIARYAADAERSYYRARREIAAYRRAQNEHAIQLRMTADREEALRRRAENEVSFAAHRQNKISFPPGVQPDLRPQHVPQPSGASVLQPTSEQRERLTPLRASASERVK
jgi:hypothetical protein